MASQSYPGFESGDMTLFDVPPPAVPEQALRQERLSSIFHNHGFFPESYDELTRATILQSFEHTRHPAVEHLGEIFIHQKKAETEDPAAAVRSVTRSMIGYATEAQRNLHFAAEAKSTIEEAATTQPQFTSLAHVPDLVDPHVEGSVRGYGQLVRYHDLSMYPQLEAAGLEPLKMNYTAKHPDPVTGRRIHDVLAQVRLYDGVKLAQATTAGQLRRYEFWTGQLKQAALHPYAKPLANAALHDLRAD